MLDKSSKDSLGNKLILNSNMAVMSVLCATDRNYLMLWITEIAATHVEDKDEADDSTGLHSGWFPTNFTRNPT